MSSKRSCADRLRFLSILIILPWLVLSCGDGWDAYRDDYNVDPGEPPGEPWVGDETVFVRLGATEIETPLEGIITSDLDGIGAVRLSDLIEASQITTNPEMFRYDFTATDGYNLLDKRNDDRAQLPNWEGQQQKRFFELSGNRLKLSTPPTLWGGGGEIVGVLLWERIE